MACLRDICLIVDIGGPLLIVVFQQSKLLLNGVGIAINIWPSLDAFRLISDSLTPYQKVQIVDASFKLCIQRLEEVYTYSVERKNAKNTSGQLSIFKVRNQDHVDPLRTIQF